MLGTIAKKMRILGFDCRYSATIDDEDLLLVAKRENCIVITKDRKLATSAKKHDILTVELFTGTEKDHLVEIAKKLSLKEYRFDADAARCPICNGCLQRVEKDHIIAKIPPRVAQGFEEFWRCTGCGHVYWKGTHIRNLEILIDEINEKL